MDKKALRQAIIEALGTALGSYTLPNGDKFPAIAFDSNGTFPPTGSTVKGMEIIIIPELESNLTPLLGAKQWECISKILLKQWDNTGDTIAATLAIVPLLGNQVKVGPRILPIDKLGNIETRTITFTQTFIRRTNGNNDWPPTV